jgi:hypothetical protein
VRGDSAATLANAHIGPEDLIAGLAAARTEQDDIQGRRLKESVLKALLGPQEAAPVRIDRFVVIDRIGSGGLGVVYSAYDPELDRKVALKLLQPGSGAEVARARLLREAKVMARLSHPNVLPVYDFGTSDGEVFLVLELVDGTDLRSWLEGRRSWRDVVEMFRGAGRGLASAHAAGVIHRDFKPSNVLIDQHQTPRVMDFGLAGSRSQRVAPPAVEAAGQDAHLSITSSRIAGTLAYMAPEQLLGQPVDARADQFAFCVALHEALYGYRPFRWTSPEEVAAAMAAGAASVAPRNSRIPTWIYRVVARGLAIDPARRWPSMNALLAELDRVPRRIVRRGAVVAAVLGVALCAGVAYSSHLDERAAFCDGPSDLTGLCDEARQQQIADVRERLAVVKGLQDAGRCEEGVALAEDVIVEATALDHPRLLAEALFLLGSLQTETADYEAAEKSLSEAAWTAEANRLDEIVARARTALVEVVGDKQARYEDGRMWARLAHAAIARLGREERLRADLLGHLAAIDRRQALEAQPRW